ncbi:Glu/Leu/Phe/Val dehydrogenase family protein [Arthrobacter sp. efr-133-TYG-104]|uniref:Glu/Leu/Phe/Val dehydrogenase family protein n=1 Tax=Arthrobacter sp. efr-133-TYG-104 TaxID=3040324 RepID=UPI00254C0D97|nr:Glu/Leu/Phe/Val dehydrogenase family protein [Arthrobacter sp. efr-133-TYG-104]
MSQLRSEYDSLFTGEQVIICSDESLGLRAVIAIDNTNRGPGFGGVRLRSYPSQREGIVEAQRLARAMTLKNAVAGIPYGGAKSIIFADEWRDRGAVMRRFGEFVHRLGGAYMPGVDMGTTTEDLKLMRAGGAVVACSEIDPSGWTAQGVDAAIAGAVRFTYGTSSMQGLKVLIQGVGHVGAKLASSLIGRGADVFISDINPEVAQVVSNATGARIVDPDKVIGYDCDIYAPCASAKTINDDSVEQLQCRIVAGAANDPLAHEAIAVRLQERGIIYVPDFVSSAGGVIHVHCDLEGLGNDATFTEISKIEGRVTAILREAKRNNKAPLEEALNLARKAIKNREPGSTSL